MRGTVVRGLVAACTLGLVLLTAGCEDVEASASPDRTSQWPAGAAGILCQLLEYDVVEKGIGVRFDTAGAAHVDNTLTCALTQANNEVPYLTLAVAPSVANPTIFTANLTPAGAVAVAGLGTAAYRFDTPPAASAGPGIELTWLSATGRLATIEYVFGPEPTPDEVTQLATSLVTFAQSIEQALPA